MGARTASNQPVPSRSTPAAGAARNDSREPRPVASSTSAASSWAAAGKASEAIAVDILASRSGSSSSGAGDRTGVAGLVVGGGVRQRDHDGGHAGGGQLGHGQRAGAGERQVAGGV